MSVKIKEAYDRDEIFKIGVQFVDGEFEYKDFTVQSGGHVDDLESYIDNMYIADHLRGSVVSVHAYDSLGVEVAELSADAYFGRTRQDFEDGRREGF